MNTSIYVELGNGDNFVFDMGEGAVANDVAARVALNQIKQVFITHLHVDHFGSLPYLWMFGTWAGGWHEPLTIHGPSGRTPEYGTKTMVEGMKMMLGWHRDAFSVFPVGQGHDIQVNEFDFRDNGGVVYEKNGVKVIHWQRSHAKDGASAYRLDWNGMCFVWTGDGRPSKLDTEYAKQSERKHGCCLEAKTKESEDPGRAEREVSHPTSALTRTAKNCLARAGSSWQTVTCSRPQGSLSLPAR